MLEEFKNRMWGSEHDEKMRQDEDCDESDKEVNQTLSLNFTAATHCDSRESAANSIICMEQRALESRFKLLKRSDL